MLRKRQAARHFPPQRADFRRIAWTRTPRPVAHRAERALPASLNPARAPRRTALP